MHNVKMIQDAVNFKTHISSRQELIQKQKGKCFIVHWPGKQLSLRSLQRYKNPIYKVAVPYKRNY